MNYADPLISTIDQRRYPVDFWTIIIGEKKEKKGKKKKITSPL